MQKVTVVMPAYNVGDYIEEAIKSVLMQKTDFEFKVLVAEDGSTDNTLTVAQKLQEEYPEKIEILTREKNIGLLKNTNRAFEHVKSQYFSLLDGDDYWVSEDRLQKQVDFLDNNPEFAMCGGNTLLVRKGQPDEKLLGEDRTGKAYAFEDYLAGRTPFIHTSSILVRNCIYAEGVPDIYYQVEDTFENCAVRGEDFRFATHLQHGKMMLFPEVLSCYRIHEKGIWQGATEIKRRIQNAISRNFFDKYWSELDNTYFHDQCIATYRNLMRKLMEGKIYNEYYLTEEETYLLTEYLKDIARRKMTWTECNTQYVKEENQGTLLQRVARRVLR